MSIPVAIMRELDNLSAEGWVPSLHRARNGKYYARDDEGEWEEYIGHIYHVDGTDEQKALFRALTDRPF